MLPPLPAWLSEPAPLPAPPHPPPPPRQQLPWPQCTTSSSILGGRSSSVTFPSPSPSTGAAAATCPRGIMGATRGPRVVPVPTAVRPARPTGGNKWLIPRCADYMCRTRAGELSSTEGQYQQAKYPDDMMCVRQGGRGTGGRGWGGGVSARGGRGVPPEVTGLREWGCD